MMGLRFSLETVSAATRLGCGRAEIQAEAQAIASAEMILPATRRCSP